nr:hypothetical protein [Tanacetum cinerariifolium]
MPSEALSREISSSILCFLRPIPLGEGSGTPTEPHHTPSPESQHTSHTTHSLPLIPSVTSALIPPVTSSETTPIRQYTRRVRIAQSSALPPVADEPASPLRDVSQREACPTDSGFIADQDMAIIAKSSTLPYDSAPRVTSPAVVEGSMQQTINELMALCTSLQRQYSELAVKFEAQEIEITRLKARVKLLDDKEGGAAEGSGDDAPTKGRNLDEGEAAAERASDDIEEMSTVLTSMDAAIVLTSRAAEVPTGSDVVPTASLVFATTTVVTPYRRRKSKEVMVESKTPKKQKVQEQIDAQVARELEEQLERGDQRMSEQIAKDAEIIRIHAEEELQIMIDGLDSQISTGSQRRKPSTKKQKRDYYMAVIRSNLGWKEEAKRIKRKGLSLEQESAKKFKPSEEVTEEAKSPDKVPEEKIKEMMQLVPIEKMEGLNQLWSLVKETLSNRPPTSDKEMELWVELSRLYEP